jgi:hypothetical protein
MLYALAYALAGVGLMLAPFLSWRNVDLMGLPVGLPGFLWHGVWLCGLGLGIALASLVSRRLWLPLALAWGVGGGLTWVTLRSVIEQSDRLLMQMQLKLVPVNEALGHFGVSSIDFYRRAVPVLGNGPRVAGAALGLLGLTLLVDLATQVIRGRAWQAVVFGRGRCPQCGWRVREGMHYCPGCSRSLTRLKLCPTCYQSVGCSDRFCSACSSSLSSS